MEPPKRISLNSSVAWLEEDSSLSMDDHWGDFLGNESSHEGQQTASFLTFSSMEASRADVSDDEDGAFYSADDDDSIPSWQEGVLHHNTNIGQIADPSQTMLPDASASWEECRRKLALSMERSKTTRFWIESNIIQYCNPTTKEALLKTLQSTALMESILQQTPEQSPWFIVEDEPSPMAQRIVHQTD